MQMVMRPTVPSASAIGRADITSTAPPDASLDVADEEVAALKPAAAPTGRAALGPMLQEEPQLGLRAAVWRARGVLVVALSGFLFSMMSTCVRVAAHVFPATQTMLVRTAIQALLSLSFLLFFRLPILGAPEVRRWVLFRGLIGATNNWVLFFVVTQMAFGDAHAIFFTSPVFTVVFSCFLLGEPFLAVEGMSMAFGIAGVVLISRPPALFGPGDDEIGDLKPVVPHAVAISICVLGAFLGGWVPIVVRRVGKAAHWMSLVFSFAFCGVILSSIALAVGVQEAVWPSVDEVGIRPYIFLVSVGPLATVAQSMWNFGLQIEKPAVASTTQLTTVPFTFVWQTVFFGQGVPSLSVVGACMVVGSTATIVGRRICSSPADVKIEVAEEQDEVTDESTSAAKDG